MIAVRATEDAITDAGLWADNARVAVYAPLAKAYAGCPVPGLDVVPPVAGAVAALAEFRPEAGELVGELLVAEAEHMAGRARRGGAAYEACLLDSVRGACHLSPFASPEACPDGGQG